MMHASSVASPKKGTPCTIQRFWMANFAMLLESTRKIIYIPGRCKLNFKMSFYIAIMGITVYLQHPQLFSASVVVKHNTLGTQQKKTSQKKTKPIHIHLVFLFFFHVFFVCLFLTSAGFVCLVASGLCFFCGGVGVCSPTARTLFDVVRFSM